MASDVRGVALGLYVTDEVVTGVLARSTRGSVSIRAVGAVSTPAGCFADGIVRDPAQLGHAVRQLCRSLGTRTAAVSVAVASSVVDLRTLQLPEVPEREQRMLVRGELEQIGVLPHSKGGLDFLWVPTQRDDDRHDADAFVCSAPDAAIDSMRDAMRAAGLTIQCLEAVSFSLVRAASALPVGGEQAEASGYHGSGAAGGRRCAYLMPAADHSDLCFHDGVGVRYVRRIASGMREIAGAAAMDLDGMPPDASAPIWGAQDPAATEADIGRTYTGGGAGLFRQEVARSISYYGRGRAPDVLPERLWVLGPINDAERVRTVLEEQPLNLPVETADPLATFPLPPVSTSLLPTPDALLAALGAALAEASSSVPAINVAIQEADAVQRRKAPTTLAFGLAGSTVWMLCALAASVMLTVMEWRLQARSSSVTAKVAAAVAERAGPERDEKVYAAAVGKIDLSAVPAAEVLGRVAQAWTPGMTVNRIKLDAERKLDVEGLATTPEPMQTFSTTLARGDVLVVPIFDMMKQQATGGYEFRVTADWPDVAGHRYDPPAPQTTAGALSSGDLDALSNAQRTWRGGAAGMDGSVRQ
jgi:Tfp pilus assembly PilM family ATPase